MSLPPAFHPPRPRRWPGGWWRAMAMVASCLAAPAACTPPASSTPPIPARSACHSVVTDALSLRFVGGHPVVTVSVNGTPVSMLLDTGAESTIVTPATAARLGLAVSPDRTSVTGVGGSFYQDAARATVALTGRGRVLLLPIVDLPGGLDDLAGVVGADLLSDTDLDLDQPGATVTFRRSTGCTTEDAAWPVPSTRLPAAFTPRGRVLVPVRLGPVSVQALLDTGSADSVLSSDTARRAGVTAGQLAAAPLFSYLGAALRPVTVRTLDLPDVEIGADRGGAFPVTISESDLPGVNMLLGNHYLSGHRLLISWSRRSVFVADPPRRQVVR